MNYSNLFDFARDFYTSFSYNDKFGRAKIPFRYFLELTYKCNLNCPYCYVGCERNKNELTTEEWKKVNIEMNDERNKFLYYKTRSTIYGINIYIISFLVIVGLLTNLPIWAPLFLAGLQLFNMVLYVWLFNKNNKAN